MPREVYSAVKDGIVSLAGHSSDTFEKLWNMPPFLKVTTQSTGGGIYIILYRNAAVVVVR